MALTVYEVQTALVGTSGDADDVFANVWHFEGRDSVQSQTSDVANIEFVLDAFWNVASGSQNGPLAAYIGENVERANGLRIKTYNLLDPKPRTPVGDVVLALGAGAVDPPLPNANAVVLQERALPVSGQNRARTRGFTLIGPLADNSNVAAQDAFNERVPAATVRQDVLLAALTLISLSNGGETAWTVFSRAAAGPEPWTVAELLAASTLIDQCRVGRAFGHVRKRTGRQPRDPWTGL